MSAVRPSLILLVFVSLLVSLAGCGSEQAADQQFSWQPLFGDGKTDTSPIVAEVGDVQISQRMVEHYIEVMIPAEKGKYGGAVGQRLALKKMIEDVLMVRGAIDLKMYNDPDVAGQLIAERRATLVSAMLNYGLLRDIEPSDDEARVFYDANKAKYRVQGVVGSRHVECLDEKTANQAYQRLQSGKPEDSFERVVQEMSVNSATRKIGGDNGLFAKGGFVPNIKDARRYATAVFDMDIGLHPPIEISGRWHVVEVTSRQYGRTMTFTEAKERVKHEMLPGWQNGVVKDYLQDARKKYTVTMKGMFAPGQGATEEELFKRAMAVTDPEEKLALLSMIHADFPEGNRADDALFLAADAAMDRYPDGSVADRYLRLLITEYPDSEFVEDAKFLRDNIHNSKVRNPQSIEDLRQN